MAKHEASVEELVSMIERGELRLPEMQRRYVWRATRVRDLMDSLYRGYPSGTILLWQTDEEVPLQQFAVAQTTNPYQSTKLLLDGQQRLTSLSAVIRGEPVTVRGRIKPVDLLFNLEHPDELSVITEVDDADEDSDSDADDQDSDANDASEDELQKRFERMAFVVSTKKLEHLPHWVKVSEVFKTDDMTIFLERAGIESIKDPRSKKYSARLAKLKGIKNYSYRMDVLERSLTYDEVTEIFVRVNSLGAKLRSSDLALAQITAKWRGALELFQSFQSECTERGFDLDLGLYLKNLVAFRTGQSRFLTIGSQSADKLKSAWSESVKGMEFALNFLMSNTGIDSPALLSSPFILVVLGYFAHVRNYEIDPDEAKRLRQWVLLSNAKGRYSRGSTDTLLDQDLKSISDGNGARELLDRLRLQVGRLDVVPEELEGRNQRSSLFKTMFMAFRANDAKDWASSLTIDLDHKGATHRLQFHHLFPKAVLKGVYTSREADDIANLSFISGKTNRKISDKKPVDYLLPLMKVNTAQFAAQCIPTNEALLDVPNYKSFLQARRVAIANRLNEFLGTSPSAPLSNEQH